MLLWKSHRQLQTQTAFTILILSVVVVLWFFNVFNERLKSSSRLSPQVLPSKRNAVFLTWTPFFGQYQYFPKSLSEIDCEYNNCVLTSNRSRIHESQAIIYHWRDINRTDFPSNDSSAIWVLFNYESPPHTEWKVLEPIISRLNLVVTYRLDSDIYSPYGLVQRKDDIINGVPEEFEITLDDFKNKKGIVFVSSNCKTNSKREMYIAELKKYINVDIYGECGSSKRCKGIHFKQCYEYLGKFYKFYLSFENSLCVDYITEKTFLALLNRMVPIVFGGANYMLRLPANSYINTFDFASPKELAQYLHTVNNNLTLYKRFHEWRKNNILVHTTPRLSWLCELCRLVHEGGGKTLVTKDKNAFYKWWFDGKCYHYFP